ncbi:transposase family protein [Micromonospora sp. MP36]|uniref:transposase family protein n=1 Tax=unclassified Micromonospora TaxID=2617518 RepID=UPI0011D377FD|nr:transposase family protein [Micromonospora sp. MP36]
MSASWRAWGRNRARPRRSFTAEFEAEIAELCQHGDRTIGQVAKDFDLTEPRCGSGSSKPSSTLVPVATG